jgi:hypothetical protein
MVLQFKTSIHENSFQAKYLSYLNTTTSHYEPAIVSLKCFGATNLCISKNTSLLESALILNETLCKPTQNLVIENVTSGSQLKFGSKVYLRYLGNFTSVNQWLSVDTDHKVVFTETKGENCEWVIVNPWDVKDSYTSDTPITNWNAVALKDVKNNRYMHWKGEGEDKLYTMKLKTEAGTNGGTKTIGDSSYVWNFDLKKEAFLGRHKIMSNGSTNEQLMTLGFGEGSYINNDHVQVWNNNNNKGPETMVLISAISHNSYLIRSATEKHSCMKYVPGQPNLSYTPYDPTDDGLVFSITGSGKNIQVSPKIADTLFLNMGTIGSTDVTLSASSVQATLLQFEPLGNINILYLCIPNEKNYLAIGNMQGQLNCQAFSDNQACRIGFVAIQPGIYMIQSQVDPTCFLEFSNGAFSVTEVFSEGSKSHLTDCLFYVDCLMDEPLVNAVHPYQIESYGSPGNCLGLITPPPNGISGVPAVQPTDPSSHIIFSDYI